MNGIGKNQLIRNLCKLAANHCSYTRQPCDCKYMDDSNQNVGNLSEQGSGCPELIMASMLLSQLSAEQFSDLCKKAGILVLDDGVDVIHLISKFQQERFEKLPSKSTAFNKKNK
jgi:hypothetical protein